MLVGARGNTYAHTAPARRIRVDTLCTRICIICKNSEMKEKRDVSAKAALKGVQGEDDVGGDGCCGLGGGKGPTTVPRDERVRDI